MSQASGHRDQCPLPHLGPRCRGRRPLSRMLSGRLLRRWWRWLRGQSAAGPHTHKKKVPSAPACLCSSILHSQRSTHDPPLTPPCCETIHTTPSRSSRPRTARRPPAYTPACLCHSLSCCPCPAGSNGCGRRSIRARPMTRHHDGQPSCDSCSRPP